MGCSSCNKWPCQCGSICTACNSSPCNCSCIAPPYYTTAEVCEEDNCERIYINQFSFSVCPQVSWNVPACGMPALLRVDGLRGATIGAYLWHPQYGYYQISSIDSEKGLLGIINTCVPGNVSPGTQIPACLCFVVTGPPLSNNTPELFPYVAIDFTAPVDGACIDITVTTTNGIVVGDTISIGTGFYVVNAFVTSDVITICNEGEGIAPNTPVIAKDANGNYQYPIVVTSNCCETITPRVDALEADVVTLQTEVSDLQDLVTNLTAGVSQITVPQLGLTLNPGDTLTTSVASATITNTSPDSSMQVLVSYVARFRLALSAVAADLMAITYTIQHSINASPYTDISPLPGEYSYTTDAAYTGTDDRYATVNSIHIIPPSGVLDIDAIASITNTALSDNPMDALLDLYVSYIVVAV